jgi:site-specific DNA recombinase
MSAQRARNRRDDGEQRRRFAAVYCRVSTFDQNRGDYTSLEDQESRLRRAAETDGYELYRVFKEVANSASLDRDELRRLLSELDQFDAVYVTKLDRLSRSMHDWCRLNELFDEHGVALVSTTQKIDTSTTMGRFFRDLLMLFAQFEREMIAERTYEKMAEQARQGKWGGGHQVLGYDVVHKKLVVNSQEAEVVRAVFQRYLELASLARTARWANLQGHRTKRVRFLNGREVAPHAFKRADIQRLLSNVAYVGRIRFDGNEYTGAHDPIVPESQFLQVQQLLTAKKDKPRRGDQTQQDTLLLGVLRCGFCGGAYTSSFVNKKAKNGQIRRYYYYKCTTKSKREAAACPGADVRADLIDHAFVSFLRRLAQEPNKLQAVVRAAEEASRTGAGGLETQRNRLVKELSSSERDSLTLVNRLTDPELADVAAIKKRLAELQQVQRQLTARITDLTLQIRDRRDETLSLEEVRDAFTKFDELWDELTFQERQYAVRLLVKQVEMHFEKGKCEGAIKIEAWGRSPKPLHIRLRDFREGRKLRNQVGRLPD